MYYEYKFFIRYVVNVFTQSVACLFILFTESFKEQKVLIQMKSNLLICYFMDHAFDVVSEKSFPNSRSQRCLPVFFSRSLLALGFTFRSVIHFQLIF